MTKTDTFVVFNMFEGNPEWRWFGSNDSLRLEKYIFYRMNDGTIELYHQVGWFAGSHYDGGGGSNPLPKEWFQLSWEKFLEQFCSRYPEKEYGVGKEELRNLKGLREFLGF